ncbi:pyridoxamine 5'-phosphate oxidase family protein [Mesorhizobium sp. M8A.F.Ca.ET.165.01.1.1]|uniref:pyridoxamine 5'-phosphate oxidase family protein n=1 Tax=Mesorhizobium sp. M8A.F.Ca.ET.165.01.1.1 TaxID=2563960 RepID=UPI00109342AD|nr:pyridoxamine 5'-phosphate oxidase family protein [Mesorhizobium sp. M8A.F.Ca.ET.165.01.1.1]TGT35700.1 pyridoxamine 5'-phosphate oxidase family protein [Mesorhizobium sp. M8A.F.Ca.ET.165.01.1.1]
MHGDERRQLIRDFLARHKLGVISTVHPDGSPEAAIIQVTVADDLNIVFDSFPASRKLANIKLDSRVAMVVGWDENVTVQIEGFARPAKANELQRLIDRHVANCPLEAEFLKEGAKLFTISPRWVRYSDFRGAPIVFELSGEPLA